MIQDAKWIACGEACETPVIHKRFFLEDPVSGFIEITGLGYFELHINGQRVSEDYLVPALSDYHSRPLTKLTYPISDTFSHRIYYLRYDIAHRLHAGENQLAVFLGNGWYRQRERIAEGELSFGQALKAVFSLEIRERSGETKTIYSDGTESYTPSYITYSNLFIGEVQDARRLGGTGRPQQVSAVSLPETRLMLQSCPPDRIIRTIQPRLVNVAGGRRIYDAGENISGWVRVRVSPGHQEAVTLRFAEELDAQGRLDFCSTGSGYIGTSGKNQIQTDVFIGDGEARVFEPKFVYHTFRYFDVQGPADELVAVVLHSSVPVTSAFHCASPALNWLYEAFIRTELDNMHGGVPSDCPHRERLGYTGDGQVTCESAMLLLDSRTFYEKWIGDLLDCQDPLSGHVQHTAPFMGGGGGPGGWGCAIVVVPYRYYRHYGDAGMLAQCYPAMGKWARYMVAHSEGGLVTSEEPGGWCLGDWAAMEPIEIPEPYVNSCYFVKALDMLTEIAAILRYPQEAKEYAGRAAQVKRAIQNAYYDPETGSFCGGIQGADAFALDIGLCDDPRTLQNLYRKYAGLGHFDTGFLGTDLLVSTLFRYGKKDLAFALLSNPQKGGYLFMQQQGATTLWEYLHGGASHCHPMFGAPVQYLFSDLLGIRQAGCSAGFVDIEISPEIPEKLDHAFGKLTVAAGEILVAWNKEGGRVEITAGIPEGVRALLKYGGRRIALCAGLQTFAFG